MRSPNPSSFKNFSAQKRKSRKWGNLWAALFFVGALGMVGFLVWESRLCSSQLTKKRKMPVPSQVIEKHPQEDSYIDFEKTKESGESTSPDMEEEEDHSSPAVDSELVQIFKNEESQNLSPFSEPALWRKNTQQKVFVPRGRAEVAIVLDKIETLSSTDWQAVHKLNIPLTFIFSASHPEAPQMAQKAWAKGREIFVKGKHKRKRLEKHFSQMLGTIEERGSSSMAAYLTLSRSKGLKGGLPHRVFSFPLVRDKKAFIKSNRSIIWITPGGGRLQALSGWIQQQKKKVIFIPLSQLYVNEEGSRRGRTIDVKKIQEGRLNLV
jgi:hypothetical protein